MVRFRVSASSVPTGHARYSEGAGILGDVSNQDGSRLPVRGRLLAGIKHVVHGR
jgi:hypothetical protein